MSLPRLASAAALLAFLAAAVLPAGAAASAEVQPRPASRQEPAEAPEWFLLSPGSGGRLNVVFNWDSDGLVHSRDAEEGKVYGPGRELMVMAFLAKPGVPERTKGVFRVGESVRVDKVHVHGAQEVRKGDLLFELTPLRAYSDSLVRSADAGGADGSALPPFGELASRIWRSTGVYDIWSQTTADFPNTWNLGVGRLVMILVACLLLYLAIVKGFEPLLLVPIASGALLANIPVARIAGPDGLVGMLYSAGIETGAFPLLIFLGVGAMTDFGPLIANPKTALLGAAAQLGIFFALIGALLLAKVGIDFNLKDAASIGIIGGADGPTAIYLTSKLSPSLLGAIAVAAYSYMALVPIIQPPIMRLLTTEADRKIKMEQLRHVARLEKICFPIIITMMCALLLPDAAPLIGFLMFGNLLRECGCVERLSSTSQNALINIVTIFLGLTVGSKLSADKFLNLQTLGILALGMIAFSVGTAGGVLFGQVMKWWSGGKVNPLIGAAGVSAVPMAARVVNKVGLEADPHNFLLMHAMGPNVSGVIGSAVVAGVLLKACSLL